MCFFFLSYARASSDLLVIEGILLYAQDTNYKGFWKKKLIDCEEPKNEKKFCSNVYILIFPWLQMIGEVTDMTDFTFSWALGMSMQFINFYLK